MSSTHEAEHAVTHARSQRASRQIAELVSRAVLEVERDERALRQRIRGLVQAGQYQEAVRLLEKWDELAAGEVLDLSENREQSS